jgi:hypothetical protein
MKGLVRRQSGLLVPEGMGDFVPDYKHPTLSPPAQYKMYKQRLMVTQLSGFGGGSAGGDVTSYAFDGTGDYLTVPDHADWDVVGSSSQDYTIDLWLKFTDHVSQEFIIGQWATSNTFWWIEHNSGGGFNFLVKDAGVTIVDTGTRAGEVTDTDWHHLALCKVTSGGPTVEWGMYLDGSQVLYMSDADTATFAGSVYLGVRGSGENNPFDGFMDDIRITDTNSFSASPNTTPNDTITVPTSQHTSDANTLLLINCGETITSGTTGSGAVFNDSGNTTHVVTEGGNAVRDLATYKF